MCTEAPNIFLLIVLIAILGQGKAFPARCYNDEDKGMLYNGTVAISNRGHPCIEWSHTPIYKRFFVTNNLQNNFCRNPFPDIISSPFCFVYLGRLLVLEKCNIRECSATTEVKTTTETPTTQTSTQEMQDFQASPKMMLQAVGQAVVFIPAKPPTAAAAAPTTELRTSKHRLGVSDLTPHIPNAFTPSNLQPEGSLWQNAPKRHKGIQQRSCSSVGDGNAEDTCLGTTVSPTVGGGCTIVTDSYDPSTCITNDFSDLISLCDQVMSILHDIPDNADILHDNEVMQEAAAKCGCFSVDDVVTLPPNGC